MRRHRWTVLLVALPAAALGTNLSPLEPVQKRSLSHHRAGEHNHLKQYQIKVGARLFFLPALYDIIRLTTYSAFEKRESERIT